MEPVSGTPAEELRTAPVLSAAESASLARLRDECLRTLAKHYLRVFVLLAIPALILTAASEGEALPVVAPAFVVLTGLLSAAVTEKSQAGERLRELDRYLRGEAPPPAYRPPAPARAADVAPAAARADRRDAEPAPPPLLLRTFYFLVAGWWLGFVWVHLAWLLDFFILGIPAGRAMVEQLPVVMTLSPARPGAPLRPARAPVPFPLAAVWYLTVGSWLSVVVTEFGYLLALLLVPRRAGMALLRSVPYVLTLRAR